MGHFIRKGFNPIYDIVLGGGVTACLLFFMTLQDANAESRVVSIKSMSATASEAAEVDNFAYYEWNEASQSWILAEKMWLPEAAQATQEPGDYIFPESTFQNGGGNGGGSGVKLQSEHHAIGGAVALAPSEAGTTDFPPMIVTGMRPTQTSLGPVALLLYRPYVIRMDGGGGGGGGIGIGKSKNGGVRQADKTIKCSSDFDQRMLAALGALPPIVAGGSVWLIRYAPGSYQMWQVTAPTMTTRGLQPVGSCVGP